MGRVGNLPLFLDVAQVDNLRHSVFATPSNNEENESPALYRYTKAFHETSTRRRKAEAAATIRMLEQVENVLAAIKSSPTQRPVQFKQKDNKWHPPTEFLAA